MKPALACAVIWCVLTFGLVAPASATEPIVAVWYRGTPAGVPRQDDLAAIRARGFSGVVWPASAARELPAVERMAAIVGLGVLVQSDTQTMRGGQPIPREARLDVRTRGTVATDLPALLWKGIAAGARVISFDPGQSAGVGLGPSSGPAPPWLTPALAVSRQLSANAELFDQLHATSLVIADVSRPRSIDVALLEAPRCWVVVATNTGRASVTATVRLPAVVPYALWVSLLDGSTMAMLAEAPGPRWEFDLSRGRALVYVIDKMSR